MLRLRPHFSALLTFVEPRIYSGRAGRSSTCIVAYTLRNVVLKSEHQRFFVSCAISMSRGHVRARDSEFAADGFDFRIDDADFAMILTALQILRKAKARLIRLLPLILTLDVYSLLSFFCHSIVGVKKSPASTSEDEHVFQSSHGSSNIPDFHWQAPVIAFLESSTSQNVSIRQSSSSSKIGGTVVDQTKENNDPNQEKTDEHVSAGKSATSGKAQDHPAKQADPQKAPERSTGFQTQGPDGRAGEGEDTGNVHKEEKPPMTP